MVTAPERAKLNASVRDPGWRRWWPMQRVHVARTLPEAHIVRGVLEAEGIASMVRGEHLASALGELPMDVDTLPSVWVSDTDAARATELVEEVLRHSTQPGTAWKCPRCGEELEGQFTECWQCGSSRPNGGRDHPFVL